MGVGGGLVRAKNFSGREKGDGREMNREGKELKFTACICDTVQGKKKGKKATEDSNFAPKSDRKAILVRV